MAAKKHKPAPAELPSTPSPSDLPDGFRMVEVEPGRWIGLPTFDISEWFDSCEIPLEERAGILERGGGYDGFQVSADLERETFKWLLEHGRPAVSAGRRSCRTKQWPRRRDASERSPSWTRRFGSTCGDSIFETSYSGKRRSRLGASREPSRSM